MNNPESVALDLLSYCRANDWAGYDPYDALNSAVFKRLPFLDFRIPRLALTQLLKRSPVNIRRLLLVPKTQNPKANALFLEAFVKLSKLGLLDEEALITEMADTLVTLRSPGTRYWCWGYSFPWQTRTILVPRWAPNLVCTSFVGNALLDAYERSHESRYLGMAVSAAEYLVNELYWTDGNAVASLGYPLASSRSPVHNANFLGAALLCRVYRLHGEKKLLDAALSVARYSAGKQREDGSWDYGELPTQRWIDNFHTGYNLCALQSISRNTETVEFDECIRRGFRFYRDHFFGENAEPKYFHDRVYPIDSHAIAQSIITLLTLKNLDEGGPRLAGSVFEWAMRHMWNENGYFEYQVLSHYRNRIPYMRWSQAWMALALATLLEDRATG